MTSQWEHQSNGAPVGSGGAQFQQFSFSVVPVGQSRYYDRLTLQVPLGGMTNATGLVLVGSEQEQQFPVEVGSLYNLTLPVIGSAGTGTPLGPGGTTPRSYMKFDPPIRVPASDQLIVMAGITIGVASRCSVRYSQVAEV